MRLFSPFIIYPWVLMIESATEPVVLGSTLVKSSTPGKGYLCPGMDSVSFTCKTAGPHLHWSIDSLEIVFNNQELDALRQVDTNGYVPTLLKRTNGYLATLIRCNTTECVSVLHIESTGTTKTVQCYNGSDYTTRTMVYHRITDPPVQPENIMEEKIEKDLLHIHWSGGNHLSHYIFEIDSSTPITVKNSSINIHADTSSDVTHTVHLYAVDECGQQSEAATKEFSVAGNPSTALATSINDMTNDMTQFTFTTTTGTTTVVEPAASTCARVYVGPMVLLIAVIAALIAVIVFMCIFCKSNKKTANGNIETPGNTSTPIRPGTNSSQRIVIRKIRFEAEETITNESEGRLPSPNTVNDRINSIFTPPQPQSELSSSNPSPNDPSPTSNSSE